MSAYLQPSHSKERWWNSNASIFPCFLLSFFPPLFHSFLFFLSFCNSLFLHIINNYLVFPSSSCSSFFVNIFPFYLTFLLLISFFNSFLLLSFSLLSLWIYVWVRKRGGGVKSVLYLVYILYVYIFCFPLLRPIAEDLSSPLSQCPWVAYPLGWSEFTSLWNCHSWA